MYKFFVKMYVFCSIYSKVVITVDISISLPLPFSI